MGNMFNLVIFGKMAEEDMGSVGACALHSYPTPEDEAVLELFRVVYRCRYQRQLLLMSLSNDLTKHARSRTTYPGWLSDSKVVFLVHSEYTCLPRRLAPSRPCVGLCCVVRRPEYTRSSAPG